MVQRTSAATESNPQRPAVRGHGEIHPTTTRPEGIRKKKKLPSIEEEVIPELALYVYMEFQDAAREDMIDLDTGALKY